MKLQSTKTAESNLPYPTNNNGILGVIQAFLTASFFTASLSKICLAAVFSVFFLPSTTTLHAQTAPGIEWDNTIGGADNEVLTSIQQTADGGYILGGYSVSNISADKSENNLGSFDYWVVKLDALGNIEWDNTIGGAGDDFFPSIQQTADGGYILGGISNSNISADKSENSLGNVDYWVIKLDALGTIEWDNTIGGGFTDYFSQIQQTADGGYILGGTSSSNISADKSENNKGNDDYWVVKLDALGAIEWDNTIGGSQDDQIASIQQTADGGYILGGFSNSNTSADKSENSIGFYDYWVVKIDALGSIEWDNTIGAASSDPLASIQQTADGGYILGGNSSSNISADKSENTLGLTDYWVVKLFCAAQTDTVTNEISPVSQTVCQQASPFTISGTDDDGIYADDISYQWQSSEDSMAWTSIGGATGQNYLPEPTSNTTYFRRIAFWQCGNSDTSNVHTLLINGNLAPTTDAGGVFFTCPSSPVTIGGSPTGSGGTSPYTYVWDNPGSLNDISIANPTANPTQNTIYTLEVTDDLCCRKIDQAVVNVYEADAGDDQDLCVGGPGVQIGTTPPQGLSATYSWSPTTGLSNANIARPIATPASTTTYTLTVSYNNNDSIPCSTNDAVEVTVVSPPPTTNFAGPDQVLCFANPTTTTIGTPADVGYSYNWSPGQYLGSNTAAQVTFNSGDNFPLTPNTITYTLTATQGLCSFTDEMELSVIRADAGIDGCGPRNIGKPDETISISETYSWSRLSSVNGTTGFLSGTSNPQVPVSSSGPGGLDVYELEVSFGGTTCIDTVEVTPCGCSVVVERSDENCPLYDGTDVSLLATAGDITTQNPNDFSYTWSPAAGLDTTQGRQVFLTDGVNRTYTVTATNNLDPSFSCSTTYEVNNPALSYPVFSVEDTTACNGESISIGNASQPNTTYAWTGPNGFTSSSSNPSILVSDSTEGTYAVRVTDDISGCYTEEQLLVSSSSPLADAGPDYVVCDNALITLGTPEDTTENFTYAWSPAASPWQNGTDENDAQPEVLIATSIDFELTVTDTVSGCQAIDSASITVDNNPTIANAPDETICLGDNVQIGLPALPGVSYTWSPSTGLSNANVAQPLASPASTTVYTVTANFPGSCASNPSDNVTVTVNDPTFDLGPDLTVCPPSGVSIGTNAPSAGVDQYIWSPTATLDDGTIRNPTATPTVETTYSLRVIYTSGCEFTDEITVTPSSDPEAGFNRTICLGETTTIGDAGNTGTNTWSGTGVGALNSTTAAAPTFDSNISGVGTFTLTLSMTENSCTHTDVIEIVVSAPPSISPSSASVCTGGCAEIGVTPQSLTTYSWSPITELSDPNIANPTVCPTASRSYQLTATSVATGCSVTEDVAVTLIPTPAPTVTVDSVLTCVGTEFTFNTTVTPAGSYSYLWTPSTGLSSPFVAEPDAIVNNNRTYTLEVTNNTTGCVGETDVFVEVQSAITDLISTQPSNVTRCNIPTPTTASFSITNNNSGTFTYQWQENAALGWQDLSDNTIYSGTTTTSLSIFNPSGLEEADYRVIVTQLDACEVVDTSNVVSLNIDNCNDPLGGLESLALTKTFDSAIPNGDGTFTVSYTVTVENTGGVTETYDLEDTPAFDDDIGINSGSFSGQNSGTLMAGTNTLATGESILAGTTHTYNLSFIVTLDLTDGVGDDVYAACTAGTPTAGEGLFNEASLSTNGTTIEAEDCGDLPNITVAKVFDSATPNGDGTFTVTYTVTVENTGGAAGSYDLEDTPGFDDDIAINSGSFSGQNSGALMAGTNTLATGESIAAGATHTYNLSFVVTLDLTDGVGDDVYMACDGTSPVAGEGLFNSASLTSNGETAENEACGDLPNITVAKVFDSATPNGDGTS